MQNMLGLLTTAVLGITESNIDNIEQPQSVLPHFRKYVYFLFEGLRGRHLSSGESLG